MLAKKALIDKIPRYSGGRIKGEEGRRLERLLLSYSYTEKELEMIAADVLALVEHYGHEGVYAPKPNKVLNGW